MPSPTRSASHILRSSIVVVFLVVGVAGGAPVTDRFLINSGDGSGLLISEVLYTSDGGKAESVYFAAGGATLDLAAGLVSGIDVRGRDVNIPLTRVEWIRVQIESMNTPKQVALRLDAVLEPSTWAPRGPLARLVLHGDTILEFKGMEPEIQIDSRNFVWTSAGECEVRVPWEHVFWIEFLRPDTYVVVEEASSRGEPKSALLRSGMTVDLSGRHGCLDVVGGLILCSNPAEEILLSDVRSLSVQPPTEWNGPEIAAVATANPMAPQESDFADRTEDESRDESAEQFTAVDPRSRRWDPSVIVELGGDAVLGASINGEILSPSGVGFRAGVGYDWYSETTVYPIQAVVLLGAGKSKFELAAGITVARNDGNEWHWSGTTTVFSGFAGYRHRSDGGTIFRIGVVLLNWTNKKIPWIGISLGG